MKEPKLQHFCNELDIFVDRVGYHLQSVAVFLFLFSSFLHQDSDKITIRCSLSAISLPLNGVEFAIMAHQKM